MAKTVDVPGVGIVEFPDSMSDDQVSQAIQKQLGTKAVPAGFQTPQMPAGLSALQPVADFAQGAVNQGMKHVASVAGLIPGQLGQDIRAAFANVPAPTTTAGQAGQTAQNILEYAAPAGAASKAMGAAPLLARLGTQAAIGAGVSGVQSNFDPKSMAVGGALGAGGELAGAAVNRIVAAAQAPKPATVEAFRDAFAATPSQLPAVQKAMPTLAKYNITPQAGIHEMQDVVQSQIGDLNKRYAQLDAAGTGSKTMPAQKVVDGLQKEIDSLAHNGYVPSADKPAVAKLQEQIEDVTNMSQNGDISFAALRRLRDAANGRTNFASPDAEQNLYRAVGNVYRKGLDEIEPGVADLNRDYANLQQVAKVADKNISYGRGVVPSRLEQQLQNAAVKPYIGAKIGRVVGEALPIPFGGTIGEAAGAAILPRLTGPAFDAVQNAMASGQLKALPGAQKAALAMAAHLGDNAAVLRILGQGAISSSVAQSAH